MKRSLLIVTALFFSAPVFANWQFYSSSIEANYYYSPDSIRSYGKLKKVWAAENFKKRRSGYLSGKFLFEIDYPKKSYRILQNMLYKPAGFTGNADLSVHKNADFHYIAPDSVLHILSKAVCSR
jgi:hypothetical protein